MKKAQRLILFLACSVVINIATAEEIKAPPRTVEDIIKVLDKASAYDDEFMEAKKMVALMPPENATNKELNTFYITRSEAFAKLGQIDKAKDDLLMVINKYPSDANTLRTQDLAMMANYEAATGNLNLAISYALQSRRNIPQSEDAMALGSNQFFSMIYSELGDFSRAELFLNESDRMLLRLNRTVHWNVVGDWWEVTHGASRGYYMTKQGKWIEAEIVLKKALDKANIWLTKVEKMPINQPGANRATDFYATARLLRSVVPKTLHIQILYSKSLSMQGKEIQAELQIRDAIDLSLRYFGKNSLQVANALLELSSIISEQGRLAEAERLAQKALDIYKEIGASTNSLAVLEARRQLAKYLIGEKKYAEADKVFMEIQTALNDNQVGGKRIELNEVDWVIAKLKLGQSDQAMAMAHSLLSQAKSQSNPSEKRIASLELLNALAYQANGKTEQAHDIYRKFAPVLVEAMTGDAESVSVGNREQDRYKIYLEGYMAVLASLKQTATSPTHERQYAAEAFTVADIVRGSGVQKALTASAARANIKDPKLAALAREEQDAQGRINSLEHLLTGLLSAPPEQQLPAVQAKMKSDIGELKVTRNKLRKEIENKFPDYASLVNPKPASIEQVSKQLKDDEVLVSWYFADKEGFVWAISKNDAPQFHRVDMGHAQMAQNVAKLRKALDPGVATIDDIPAFDVSLAHQMHQALLAPVQSVWQGKKVMLAVPHAELGQLPLSLLVTKPGAMASKGKTQDFSEYRQVAWLAKDIAVTQLPSVTALSSLRNLPPAPSGRRPFIGFGDPYFSTVQAKQAETKMAQASAKSVAMRGVPLTLRNAPKTAGVSSAELALLPRLPDTKEEIEQIGKALSADPQQDIFLERSASVSKVLELDLSNRQVVMFATHGLIPGELDGLTQPALALSAPDVTGETQGDGLLTMEKILTLKLNADWVVLSACNTASGDGAGSEAVSGLGRAFFYAGARALLVSNWPVDSEASRKLMTDLFKRYTQDKSKPQALQQASLQLMNNGVPDDAKARYTYAHPLFWAPFTMVGN